MAHSRSNVITDNAKMDANPVAISIQSREALKHNVFIKILVQNEEM